MRYLEAMDSALQSYFTSTYDILLGPSDGMSNVKRMIMPLYKTKDPGPAIYFLGIDIQRLPNGRIKLSQTHYIERILERFVTVPNCQ